MSKAVLAMDMPECCADCPCSFFERENPKLNLICGPAGDDANNVGKPDWCPLRPMPEEREENHTGTYKDNFNEGWNACIDAIGGGESDRTGSKESNGN